MSVQLKEKQIERMIDRLVVKRLRQKKGFVVITRKQYEKFLHLAENASQTSEGILRSKTDIAAGKIHGPFDSAKKLIAHLQK